MGLLRKKLTLPLPAVAEIVSDLQQGKTEETQRIGVRLQRKRSACLRELNDRSLCNKHKVCMSQ